MTTLIISLAAFLASLLTLYSGFGLGTLLMPVVAVFFPVAVAVALTALVHLLNNLFKLASLWRDIDWTVTLRFGLPAFVAAAPGALLLTALAGMPTLYDYALGGVQATVTPIKLVVGLLLIVFATAEWLPATNRRTIDKRFLPVGGLLSGFFGGLSGHQGAFRSAFLVRAGLEKHAFVATNAAIASLVDVTRLLIYGLSLDLLLAEVHIGLLLSATVAAFLGVMAGKAGLKKITIGMIRKLVAVLLYLLGACLIAGLI